MLQTYDFKNQGKIKVEVSTQLPALETSAQGKGFTCLEKVKLS